MKLKIISLLFLAILVFGISCHTQKNILTDKGLQELIESMTGSFNSENQAATDSNYYNISLHMYPIWTNKTGNWLYVEQALNSMQDKPYRQRIYKVWQKGNNQFVSEVFRLKNEKDFIGKWNQTAFFDAFDEDILEIREGCEVYLDRKNSQLFSGSTLDKTCLSSLRGASYANSIVSILKNKIESWDQGFDDKGQQVWGATEGSYIFDKLK